MSLQNLSTNNVANVATGVSIGGWTLPKLLQALVEHHSVVFSVLADLGMLLGFLAGLFAFMVRLHQWQRERKATGAVGGTQREKPSLTKSILGGADDAETTPDEEK